MKQSVDGKYRAVRDTFWTDIFVLDLTPDEKLFYIWLFTNQHLDTCGCYQISLKTIEYETGLSPLPLIQRFVELGRILFNEANKELILLKWKNNNSGFFSKSNKNAIKSIRAGLAKVKTPEFKDIILSWIGDKSAPTQGVGVAPTLPPTQGDTPGVSPNHNHNHNLITSATTRAHARTREGGESGDETIQDQTPPPSPVVVNRTAAQEQIFTSFQKHRSDLERLFPDIDLDVAIEKLLARNREGPLLIDPYERILKWMQNEFKPAAGGGNGNGRGHSVGHTGRASAAYGSQETSLLDDEETVAFCSREWPE